MRNTHQNPEILSIIKTITWALVLSLSLPVSFAADSNAGSFQDLDKNIVKAYNSDPRNTEEVYNTSLLILEKASKAGDSESSAWQLKAQKLITVSCYYECTKAIDKKLYRQAYVWARRGEKNGTTVGKIGDVPVKNLYEYLTFASKELKEIPVVKNSSPEELSMITGERECDIAYPQVAALISVSHVLTEKLGFQSPGMID